MGRDGEADGPRTSIRSWVRESGKEAVVIHFYNGG